MGRSILSRNWLTGFRVQMRGCATALVVRDERGREVPGQGPRREVTVDLPALAGWWRGSPVTAETNAPGWDGRPVDDDLCVAAFA